MKPRPDTRVCRKTAHGRGCGILIACVFACMLWIPGESEAAFNTAFTKDVRATQDFSVSGTISKSAGTFVIDHPLDPLNKLLYHSFVESPDAKNMYFGTIILDENGEAVVYLPSYFMALNTDFRYQLQALGASMPNLHVKKRITDGEFVVGGGAPHGKVSWQVTGTRHDAFIQAHPIRTEVRKGPGELVDAGEYLYEGARPRFLTHAFAALLRTIVSHGAAGD